MSRSSVVQKLKTSTRPKRRSAVSKSKSLGRGNKNVWLAVLTLIGVGFLIILAKIIGFVISLDQPHLSDNSSDPRLYSWDGRSNINLVVKSDYIYTLSFQPNQHEVRIQKIPDDTYMTVPYGFGSWPVKSIYQLGQDESPNIGMKLLMETLENELDVPIDGYIIMSGELSQKPLEREVESLRSGIWAMVSFIKSSRTNLSLSEMISLLKGINGTRSDKVTYLDLGESQVTKSYLLADGSRGLRFDYLKMQPFIKSNFEDQTLRGEEVAIAVVNSTEKAGLAEKAASLIENLGGRVIYTGSIKDNLPESLVLGESTYTQNRLAQVFAPQCQGPEQNSILKLTRKEENPSDCIYTINSLDLSRADVVVILGQDFAKKQE